ncbi:hypothetical protein GGI09_000166 [Coemansia sp. S100]|nr:hypothetical protein GGI09_000166 [Coemansia sp. S100]
MRTFSAFQLLPNHAIERIVDHVMGRSRVLPDGVWPHSNEHRILLRPLLSVCHGFRAIALARYCGFCKLELATSYTFKEFHSSESKRISICVARNESYKRSSDPRGFGYRILYDLGHPTHHLVRELMIELDERDIYSGEALRMLTNAPYEGCAFPLVRKIAFRIFIDVTDEDYEKHLRNQSYKRRMMSQTSPSIGIYDSYSSDEEDDAIRPNMDNTTDPSILEANISAFVQRIEQMAPRVGDIQVLPRLLDYSQEPRRLFGSLVTQLFQLAQRITYGDGMSNSVPVTLQPNHICDLAHISFDIDIDTELNPFVQLAQRSALTLQSLIVGYNSYVYPNDFFVEPGGGYLVYPRLLTLKLLGMHSIREGEYPVFPGAVPFPNLRHLYMDICYPFSDDTLFRGNSATLEYLNMELDHHSCPVLYEYNVFSPGSHPKLWCVDVTLSEDVMPDPDADTADYLEYVLNIGSEASVRTIKGYVDDRELASALYLLEDYSCIRVLSLPGLRWLELMDIIELIECLPLLTDLTTSPTRLQRLPEDITDDELPEYLTDVYAPLSERFRCWSFMQTGVGDEVVRSVLLLALICPNFDYANPLAAERDKFAKMMEETIDTDVFEEYSPRLRRLLF